MVKVKIEVNGEEKQVITGDMVNAVVLDKEGCKVALVSSPSEDEIQAPKFVKSLVYLVQNAIKAFAHDDATVQDMLHLCFAIEMKQAEEARCKKEEKWNSKQDTEHHGIDDLLKILRKVVED
jgi:hypothetical protein